MLNTFFLYLIKAIAKLLFSGKSSNMWDDYVREPIILLRDARADLHEFAVTRGNQENPREIAMHARLDQPGDPICFCII